MDSMWGICSTNFWGLVGWHEEGSTGRGGLKGRESELRREHKGGTKAQNLIAGLHEITVGRICHRQGLSHWCSNHGGDEKTGENKVRGQEVQVRARKKIGSLGSANTGKKAEMKSGVRSFEIL